MGGGKETKASRRRAGAGLPRARPLPTRQKHTEFCRNLLGFQQILALDNICALEQRGLWARKSNWAAFEVNQALQMNLVHPNLMREPDEGRKLLQRFAQSCEPERKPRLFAPMLLFKRDEVFDVAHDPLEKIAAPHSLESLRLRRIERDAHFIEACFDNLAALLIAHQRSVRIEQHIDARGL